MLGSREHAVFVISLSSEVGCLLLAMLFAFLLTVEIQTRNYDFPLATELNFIHKSIQSKHSNASIASMNGVILTSDESKLAAYTSNAICTKQFLEDNCRG